MDAVERLKDKTVALSALSRVKGYTRKTKSGKTVQVSAHTRSVGQMTFKELKDNQKSIGPNPSDPQDKNRLQQIINELRKRGWEPDEEFDPAKAQRMHKEKVQTMSGKEDGYDFSSHSKRRKGAH